MKNPILSKNKNLRNRSELIRLAGECFAADPDLDWAQSSRDRSPPEILELRLDGRTVRFSPLYELKPSILWLQGLTSPRTDPLLLVVPDLSKRVLDCCRSCGISVIDLNGQAWLRAPGVLVERQALPGRGFRYELQPRNIYVGKSERIVRTILTDRDRVWTQAELCRRSQASSGLVSRIVQHLVNLAYLKKKSAREYLLSEPLALLEDWAAADRMENRATTTAYAGLHLEPVELARKIQDWAVERSVPFALTQWVAAWLRHPYTEPGICSAYVESIPDDAELTDLGLRPVDEGGKLWLHVPNDTGVFWETQETNQFTLASDAQIYLDLQRTGLRGPDAAKALIESRDFCRP